MKHKCYACNRVATSSEHVPPLCLFPHVKDHPDGKDFRRNLITVPSCDEHNGKKSGDDQHLMYVLSMTLAAGAIGESHFATKGMRSIERRPALAISMLRTALPVVLHDPSNGDTFETVAIRGDTERVCKTLELVARGLYFHHFGNSWDGPLRVVPEFFRWLEGAEAKEWNSSLSQGIALARGVFSNAVYFGDNPEVFSYQAVDPGSLGPVVMRMQFYNGCNVIAIFGAP